MQNVSEQSAVEKALAAVAQSRERREHWNRVRKETFERIQIANMRKPAYLSRPGTQLSLDLHS